MNIIKYLSFIDIMKNIFISLKNNIYFFFIQKKIYFSIKKDDKGSVCDFNLRKDWFIRI